MTVDLNSSDRGRTNLSVPLPTGLQAHLYTTTEKFVEIAFKHEQRLGALCKHIQGATGNPYSIPTLPQLVIDYVRPDSHPCQCADCMPDLTTNLKRQLFEEMQDEVRESLGEEVVRTTTKRIRPEQHIPSSSPYPAYLRLSKHLPRILINRLGDHPQYPHLRHTVKVKQGSRESQAVHSEDLKMKK